MTTFTRPPPPQGAPPAYAMVTKVYRRSLRPIVVGIGLLAAIWALIWGIASFRDISIDKEHAAKLEVFDIVLGSLYMATFAIELFGLAAAVLQKLAMIRIYAFASLGVAVIITATELIRVIIHFAFKSTLINECIALSTNQTVETRVGIWGTKTTTLNGEDASTFCNSAWSHDSFSEIAWFIVAGIASLLFASITFSYYRQMLDPTSVVNATRAPVGQMPEHYNPPYANGAFGYDVGVGAGGYAPPPGPPPAQSVAYVPQYDSAKLPEYERGGYLDASDDKKGDDLKGGTDPFADYETLRRNSGSRESAVEAAKFV
ncbi:hypothetical protein EW145_g5792 [Phellinidium pouzarii]|uniref:Uncharacterized protein n=1 Tax=Phellinidium pouzarii TaxID=167371 RepID=A0A4S4KZ12_9AGAM|nr:hypothetical protein EW145_g5792 [Phellinidium pouzarii]